MTNKEVTEREKNLANYFRLSSELLRKGLEPIEDRRVMYMIYKYWND